MLLAEKEAELLAILTRDSRKTVSALARELELSRPTVQSMLERLDAVAIEKYTVKLKSEFADRFIRAFVFMVRDPKHWSRIKSAMLKIEEVKAIDRRASCRERGEISVVGGCVKRGTRA